jgi:hypothetical protein
MSSSTDDERKLPANVEKQRHAAAGGPQVSPDASHDKEQAVVPASDLAEEDDDDAASDEVASHQDMPVGPELVDPDAPGVTGALGRVLSRISTNVSTNPGPPPDGGRQAWFMGEQQ